MSGFGNIQWFILKGRKALWREQEGNERQGVFDEEESMKKSRFD